MSKGQGKAKGDLRASKDSTWAAITKYHRLGDLNNRNVLSYNPGSWKSKVQLPLIGLLERNVFLAFRQPPSCHVLMWPFLGMSTWREGESQLSGGSFSKGTNLIGSGSHPYDIIQP